MKFTFILASQSPRRKELVGHLNIPFVTMSPDIDESSAVTDPLILVQELARAKGQRICQELLARPDFGQEFFPVILSADTVVALDGKILGKPLDAADAKRMLQFLSGRAHTVATGVFLCLYDATTKSWRETVFVDETRVSFAPISEDLLQLYVKSGEPMDKAGAYGIQGEALSFITKVEGSYSNVVGLPLSRTLAELKKLLGMKDDQEGKWRELFHG